MSPVKGQPVTITVQLELLLPQALFIGADIDQ
jgi:hypothetical protein